MNLFRNSPPATLKVLAPPTVLRGPQDTEVIEGEGLDLPCEVSFELAFLLIKFNRILNSNNTIFNLASAYFFKNYCHLTFFQMIKLTGDPIPVVTWHRENGDLPDGRSRILLDNTLRIEDTRAEDQGRYVCEGINEGGNVTIAVEILVFGEFKIKIKFLCLFHNFCFCFKLTIYLPFQLFPHSLRLRQMWRLTKEAQHHCHVGLKAVQFHA